MTTNKIKGNIVAILTMFLLVFVSGIAGNEFTNYRQESSVILGYGLISLEFGAFVGMCFMIKETFEDITKLADESLHAWDALQNSKMENIQNLKKVYEENISYYEAEIIKFENEIRQKTETGSKEIVYINGHIAILQKLITKTKYQLEQLLLS